MKTLSFAMIAFGLLGCAGQVSGGAFLLPDSEAPGLVSTDRADRSCELVLRQVNRTPKGEAGNFETSCEGERCWYIWQGAIDINAALDVEEVAVIYRSSIDTSAWYQVSAEKEGRGRDGFDSYRFTLSSETLPEGTTKDSLELIPYIQLSDGRLFDHNRNAGDFALYSLHADNDWSIQDRASDCAATEGSDFLAFDGPKDAWGVFSSDLKAGSSFVISYDTERLPTCRGTHNGFRGWSIEASVRFLNGGPFTTIYFNDLPTYSDPINGWESILSSSPIEIPPYATRVEVFFQNSNVNNCRDWDSNFGSNFLFPL